MWVPATDVAKAAVDGLEAGRAVVIPGPAEPDGRGAGPPGAEVTDPAADGAAPPVAPADPKYERAVAAMPQLVTELDLPYLDTIGLERREAVDADCRRRGRATG